MCCGWVVVVDKLWFICGFLYCLGNGFLGMWIIVCGDLIDVWWFDKVVEESFCFCDCCYVCFVVVVGGCCRIFVVGMVFWIGGSLKFWLVFNDFFIIGYEIYLCLI